MRQQTLRDLVAEGRVARARVVGLRGGYGVVVTDGPVERLLATSRGETRLFTLDAATKFLRDIGLPRFEVDASNYEPGRLRSPRPDRAEALRRTRTNPHQPSLV